MLSVLFERLHSSLVDGTAMQMGKDWEMKGDGQARVIRSLLWKMGVLSGKQN